MRPYIPKGLQDPSRTYRACWGALGTNRALGPIGPLGPDRALQGPTDPISDLEGPIVFVNPLLVCNEQDALAKPISGFFVDPSLLCQSVASSSIPTGPWGPWRAPVPKPQTHTRGQNLAFLKDPTGGEHFVVVIPLNRATVRFRPRNHKICCFIHQP